MCVFELEIPEKAGTSKKTWDEASCNLTLALDPMDFNNNGLARQAH